MGDVKLEVTMRPSSRFEIKTPTDNGKDETTHVAQAGSLLLKALTMPHAERVALLSEQANDEVLILFAFLTPSERRELVRAAETFLKEQVTKI